MQVSAAASTDIEQAVDCLVVAFAADPITGFLLGTGPSYPERLKNFFALLMRARIALSMPVLLSRGEGTIRGAAMGYTTARPTWPEAITRDWETFEKRIPGFSERLALYGEVSDRSEPPEPHFYLGVIGVDPARHGLGLGWRLLKSFCELSEGDRLSSGVYLETASPSNVQFYERAGFAEVGRGSLGNATLWCMFLEHRQRHDA